MKRPLQLIHPHTWTRLSNLEKHTFAIFIVFCLIRHLAYSIPFPVALSLKAGLATFAILPTFPLNHPLSIPAAFGAGLSLALFVTALTPPPSKFQRSKA
jgi:hypothetical protein